MKRQDAAPNHTSEKNMEREPTVISYRELSEEIFSTIVATDEGELETVYNWEC